VTADSRTHAKGWYVDPDDDTQLRYWDGGQWGDERRARPSWGGPAGDAPSPDSKHRDRRRLFAVVVVIGALLCAVVWFSIPKRPDPTISDAAFRSAANDLCAATFPDLRAERRPERNLSDGEVADRVDEVADELDGVVRDLGEIPVQAADRAEVEAWIDAWAAYVEVGRSYAEAIRTGDADHAERVRAGGDDEARAIGRFASGNRIDACVPYQLG